MSTYVIPYVKNQEVYLEGHSNFVLHPLNIELDDKQRVAIRQAWVDHDP